MRELREVMTLEVCRMPVSDKRVHLFDLVVLRTTSVLADCYVSALCSSEAQ